MVRGFITDKPMREAFLGWFGLTEADLYDGVVHCSKKEEKVDC